MDSQHENSRPIIIRSKLPFNHEAQEDHAEWFREFKRSIGSFFEKNSAKIGSGLTYAEQKTLMPHVINIEADDKGFKKEVELFFINIHTNIPYEEGKTFETGLVLDNNKPIEYTENNVQNLPINVAEYISYKHALAHPQVAGDSHLGAVSSLKQYFVVDESKDKADASRLSEIQDDAAAKYREIKTNSDIVEAILADLGVNYFQYPKADRKLELKKFIDINPAKFLESAKREDLIYIRFIERLVNSSVVRKEGTKYIFETEMVGETKNSFIAYLKDEANSEKKAVMKARLQQEPVK
jgi:hypothetical protein